MTAPRRCPLGTATIVLGAMLLAACGSGVDQAQVDQALGSVAAWLEVDDDEASTEEAVRRADRLLAATRPVVRARPSIADLDADETAAFHDALTDLRASVADQRDVLAGCDRPDPAACLARSELDPRRLADAVARFQDALAPLDPPRPTRALPGGLGWT